MLCCRYYYILNFKKGNCNFMRVKWYFWVLPCGRIPGLSTLLSGVHSDFVCAIPGITLSLQAPCEWEDSLTIQTIHHVIKYLGCLYLPLLQALFQVIDESRCSPRNKVQTSADPDLFNLFLSPCHQVLESCTEFPRQTSAMILNHVVTIPLQCIHLSYHLRCIFESPH